MSPGIGITVSVPGQPTPRLAVLAAVHRARAEGIPLCFGDVGVKRGPLIAPWVIDRRRLTRGVNIAGALLLILRPVPEDDIEDPTGVAGRALGVGLAWISGLVDGWNRETHDLFVIKADREGYLCGYEVGQEARHAATLVCDCGCRRFKAEPKCPGCGR